MEIGKKLAEKMKKHYQECGKCEYCDVLPDILDIKTMIIKESDCICAFWEIIGHTIDDDCIAYIDGDDCFGCDLMDELFLKYPKTVVEVSEFRRYVMNTLNPIRAKYWKKEGILK